MKTATSSRRSSASSASRSSNGTRAISGQQRAEPVGERGLAVDRQRPERQAVEGMLDADDPLPARRGAAQLERGLDRLGAAGGEERLADRRGRAPDELLGEERRDEGDAHLRRVRRLPLHRLDQPVAHARVRAADVEHAEAAQPVEVAVPVGVVEVRALGAGPVAVEPDRAQDTHHLRIDVLGEEVESLARPPRQQFGELTGHASELTPRYRARIKSLPRRVSYHPGKRRCPPRKPRAAHYPVPSTRRWPARRFPGPDPESRM